MPPLLSDVAGQTIFSISSPSSTLTTQFPKSLIFRQKSVQKHVNNHCKQASQLEHLLQLDLLFYHNKHERLCILDRWTLSPQHVWSFLCKQCLHNDSALSMQNTREKFCLFHYQNSNSKRLQSKTNMMHDSQFTLTWCFTPYQLILGI